MVGIDSVDVRRTEILDYFPEEDRETITREALPRLIENGSAEAEVRFYHFKTRELIPVSWNAFAIRDPKMGAPVFHACVARNIADRKRAEQEQTDLAGRLIHAHEEERSRIGRELHDHVSQRLGLLAMSLESLRPGPSYTASGLRKGLEKLTEETNNIIDDIHRISYRLHSSMLELLGLVPALNNLVAEFSARQDIRLTVEDAGVGFDPKTLPGKTGLGFVNLRERLRLVRGAIRIESSPSQGTRIEAWVPLQ